LLEEERRTAPYLNVRTTEIIIVKDLFRFAEVGSFTVITIASGVVASARVSTGSPCDEEKF